MSYNGNHIYAPVNTDDVATVCGIPSHDVATLCTADEDHICPYSLIRPLFSNTPNMGPADMENSDAGSVPAGYEQKKWGFMVPFAGNPSNIKNVVELPWIRQYPTPEGDDFKILDHFDGYLHNVEPVLPVSVYAVAGKKIVLNIFPGNPQTDIVSSDGINNNGGIVAIPEVLGNVYLGCQVYVGNTINGVHIATKPVSTTSKNDIEAIVTQTVASSNQTYKLIPFACTKAEYYESGNRFYSLKFAPNYESIIQVTIPQAVVAIQKAVVSVSGGTMTITVTFINQFTTGSHIVNNFKLIGVYTGGSTTLGITDPGSVTVPVKVGNTDGSITQAFTVTDFNIVNNYKNDNMKSLIFQAKYGSQTLSSPELAGVQSGLGNLPD